MEEKERFESKYNEKLMKHYAFDNENKEELGYKGVVRVLNQQDKKIKDLEDKLADSEKQIKDAREAGNMAVDSWCKNRRKYEAQIAELQKQLKEEEKEIEQLKKFDDLNKTFFDLFRTAFKKPNKVDDLFNALKTMQEKQDQDKISFAVERLEKLKVELHTIHTNGYLKAIDEEIDNQINELKGKVKNE